MTIARLFGKSPFAPLQSHMRKVSLCIEKLSKVFESLQDSERIQRLVTDLSQLEHDADLTKNDIRNHLPKSLFMPIDRSHFLEILALQDSIADVSEKIGLTLSLRPLSKCELLKADLYRFFQMCLDVFWDTKRIIEEIDELLESAFGGIEAEKVRTMVEETAYKEHQAQKQKLNLLKKLYLEGDDLSSAAFHHWFCLIEEVALIAQTSEKLANRIRMVLETK